MDENKPNFERMADNAMKSLSSYLKASAFTESIRRIFAENKRAFDLLDQNLINLPKPMLPPNITDRKLEVLVDIRNQLSESAAIVEIQRKQLKIIYDSSEMILKNAAEAFGQTERNISLATKALFVAIIGIIVSVSVTWWSVSETNQSNRKMVDVLEKQLILARETAENSRLIPSNLITYNSSIENLKLISAKEFNFIKEQINSIHEENLKQSKQSAAIDELITRQLFNGKN